MGAPGCGGGGPGSLEEGGGPGAPDAAGFEAELLPLLLVLGVIGRTVDFEGGCAIGDASRSRGPSCDGLPLAEAAALCAMDCCNRESIRPSPIIDGGKPP